MSVPAGERVTDRQAALRTMAERFAVLASSARDQGRQVRATPGWSINDVLGHVAMEPSRYDALARGGGTWPATATDLPAFNAEQISNLPTRDPGELAQKLVADTDALLDTIDSFGDEPPMMLFDGNQRLRADRALGTLLGELVVHGHDIAQAVGADWPIDDATVPLVLDGLHQIMPVWVNRERAAGHSATYRLKLRRLGVTHTYAFRHGRLVIDPSSPGSVDVHISARPATWLLLSYGRIDQWRPAVTGRIVAWGRKPWLAAGFARRFNPA